MHSGNLPVFIPLPDGHIHKPLQVIFQELILVSMTMREQPKSNTLIIMVLVTVRLSDTVLKQLRQQVLVQQVEQGYSILQRTTIFQIHFYLQILLIQLQVLVKYHFQIIF